MWFKHRNLKLSINLNLVKERNIDLDQFLEIIKLHKERYDLFYLLERTKDRTFMKALYNQLTQVEFELQDAWGFPQNSLYHKSWRWPHCTCPKMDNEDSHGYLQYFNSNCPLHGN